MAGGIDFRLTAAQSDALKRSLEQLGPAGEAALAKIKTAQAASELEKATLRVDQLKDKLEQLGSRGAPAAAAGLKGVEQAAQRTTGGVQLAGYQITNLGQQIQDFVIQVGSGQNALVAFGQQAPQAAFAVGGFANLLKLALNPLVLATAGVTALAGGMIYAAAQGEILERSFKGFETALAATGRASALSRGELAQLVDETARLAGVNRDGATATVAEFAKVRAIGAPLMGELTKLVGDFAKATGQDAPEAARELAKAFADPAKGAQELSDRFGILTAEQLQLVKALAEGGNRLDAQRVLADGVNERFQGLAREGMTDLEKKTDDVAKAWDRLKRAVLGGAAAPGRGVAELETRLGEVRAELAKPSASRTSFQRAELERERLDLEQQLARERPAETQAVYEQIRQNYLGTGQTAQDVLKGGIAAGAKFDPQESRLSDLRGAGERVTNAIAAARDTGASGETIADLERQLQGITDQYEKALVTEQDRAKAAAEAAAQKERERAAAAALREETRVLAALEKEREKAFAETERQVQEITDRVVKQREEVDKQVGSLEQQTRLVGLSKDARADEEAIMRVQAKVGRELLDGEKERVITADRANRTAQERVKAEERAAQESLRIWDRTADRIGDALGDALFETSGNFWESFKKAGLRAAADIFSAQFIRPAVSSVFGALGLGSGAAGGAGGGFSIPGFGGAPGLLSSLGGLASGAGGLGSLFGLSGFGGGILAPGQTTGFLSGIGSLFGFGGGAAAAGEASAAALGFGTASSGLAGTGLAASGIGAYAGPLSLAAAIGGQLIGGRAGSAISGAGTGAAIGTFLLPGIGTAIGALGGGLLGGLFGGKPSVGPNGGAQVGLSGGVFGIGATGGDNGYSPAGDIAAAQAIADALNQIAAAPGSRVNQDRFVPGRDVFGVYNGQGDLGSVVQGFLQAGILEADPAIIAGALAGKLGAAIEQVQADSLRPQLLPEIQQQIQAQQQLAQAYGSANAAIQAQIASWLTDQDLSPLSPLDRLAEARGQYAAAAAAARSGDLDAFARAQQLAGVVLQASQAYNGPGPGYVSDFNVTRDSQQRLADLAGLWARGADTRVAELQQQAVQVQTASLAVLQAMLAELQGTRQAIEASQAAAGGRR